MTEIAQERPTFDLYGKLRPVKNVKPGWHLWTTEGWFEVQWVVETENIFTHQKSTRFLFSDGTHLDKLRADDVMCRTAAEAKRAEKSGQS